MRAAVCLLLFLFSCCGRPILPDCDVVPPQPFKVPNHIRVALVLGSGGVRGMAHVGVLEELINAGVPIDLIVGCSAGSIVGALYADSLCLESVKRAVAGLKRESILDIDLWHCRYGLSQGRFMHKVLNENLCARTFEELQIPLVVVTSDLCTAELVPIGSGDLAKAIQASCSIPFVFVPCRHLGRSLVDGGTINPVPVKVARDLGAEVVIAVDLGELLPKTMPRNLFEVATRSAEIAFMWQNEFCTQGADVIIRPRTCGVGCFNEEMKWELYLAGKCAAQEEMDRILDAVVDVCNDRHQRDAGFRTVCLAPYTPKIYAEECYSGD